MSLKIAEVLNLLIEPLKTLRSILFNGLLKRFLRVIKDLNVKILDTIVIVHIFMAKIIDPKYSMILRNLYLVSAYTEVNRDSEGNYFVKLYN